MMKTKIQLYIVLSMVLFFAASSLWAQDSFRADTLFATQTSMEMTLDGELTEPIWQQTPVMVYWDSAGISDNTSYCSAVWDETYLYLAHNIVDEDLIWADDDNAEWGHDGVEFFLNPWSAPEKGSFEDTGITHFIVTIGLYLLQDPMIWDPDPEPGEFAAMSETDSGYIIEIFLPREELALDEEMEVGNIWRLLSGTNDEDIDDAGARQYSNTNVAGSWHVAEGWGYIEILGAPTSVDDKIYGSQNPAAFQLTQNYPNPFNPSTTISYNMEKAGHVKITISDLLGKEVATLVDGHNDAGAYAVHWSGADMPSGIYLCRMQAEDAATGQRYSEVRKLVLQK